MIGEGSLGILLRDCEVCDVQNVRSQSFRERERASEHSQSFNQQISKCSWSMK